MIQDVVNACNDSAAKILRCEKAEIIGRTPAEFSPPVQEGGEDSRVLQDDIWEKACAGESPRFNWRCCRGDGEIAELDVQVTALDLAGQPTILVTGRDITEVKAAQDAVRKSEAGISLGSAVVSCRNLGMEHHFR